jgi:hypothetical protein
LLFDERSALAFGKRLNESLMDSPSIFWRLFALEPERLTPIERMLLRIALVGGILIALWTFLDIRTYAGVDLRNRVVGARVMLAGYDPYTFVWESGLPDTLLDPVYDPKAHRLTLSPPTLLPYAAMAPLHYRVQRFLHWLAEWAALIASIALLARTLPEQRQRALLLLAAAVFVVATDVWRLHLERGQVYVFNLLAISVATYCTRCGLVDSLGAGVALGVLGLMRPNLLLFAPGLLLMRQWRGFSALCATVALGVGAAYAALPESSWRSYLDVGDQYFRSIQDPESVPDRPRPSPHGIAEGTNFDAALPNVESSAFAPAWRALHERFGLPMIDVALTSKIGLVCVALALLGLLAWGVVRGEQARRQNGGWALMMTVGLCTEFFLPHRWGYADVMLLAPLAIMLPELLRPERRWALAIVVFGLLCGPLGQQFIGLQFATILRSCLVMGGLSALALVQWIWYVDGDVVKQQ